MGEVDRRQFLQRAGVAGAAAGAAWAAPSVLGSDVAWAFGSCPATISSFPTTTANTNSNGWTRTVTAGTFTTGNPFSGNNGLLGISPTAYLGLAAPLFLSEDDPTALVGGVATVTYSTNVSVVSGRYYRFTFQAVSTAINAGAQIMDVLVGGVTQMRFTTDSLSAFGTPPARTLIPNGRPGAAVPAGSNGSSQAPATYSFVYLASTTGTVAFTYQFSLNTNRSTANVPSDDIGVSAPTMECSLTGT